MTLAVGVIAGGMGSRSTGAATAARTRRFDGPRLGLRAAPARAQAAPAVVLHGTWCRMAAPAEGDITTTHPGNTARITFNGPSVALYRHVGPDGGVALVTLDGHPYGSLVYYSRDARPSVPAVLDHLGSGRHTLVLQCVDPLTPIAGPYEGVSNVLYGIYQASQYGIAAGINIGRVAVPSGLPATLTQQLAEQIVNHYRHVAGLPPVRNSQALDLAAQAHAAYLVHDTHGFTRFYGHNEDPADPGFVGVWPVDRALYYGYHGLSSGSSENYAWATGATTGPVARRARRVDDPRVSVDVWMSTVYHRALILDYNMTDLGYSGASQAVMYNAAIRVGVLEMGYGLASPSSGPSAQTPGWISLPPRRELHPYPAARQAGIPTSWDGVESPDPAPGLTRPLGYPISLSIVQSVVPSGYASPPGSNWVVRAASLRNAAGRLVPTVERDMRNDPAKDL